MLRSRIAAVLVFAGLSAWLLSNPGAVAAQQDASVGEASTPPGEMQWWRGNTHTHTLWSDGNAAPEVVAKFYRTHGYQFLVLSDHNILSNIDRWFPISEEERSRLTPAQVDEIRNSFGDEWVNTTTLDDGRPAMRLKTLSELRERFEEPGEFIFIQGEEITDHFDRAPVHVNGIHLEEVIPPQGGTSVRDVMQRNIDAVIAQSEKFNQPMLAHVNHPNFGWAMTPMDIASIRGEHFFEVYNGHSAVRNYGDEDHPSTEAMWDVALTLRLAELRLGVLYGVATDDSHDYFNWGVGHTNPGRGWVMVRAKSLDPAELIEAMERGDFYASSGVTLRDVRHDDHAYVIDIDPEEGVTYTTEFIGTRIGGPHSHGPDIGEVLFTTTENPALYEFTGDELYVRAKVTSSKLHPNPYAEGDHQCAWVQPVMPKP